MRTMVAMICTALFSAAAMAGGYNEDKKGDLSNDGMAPTKIKLALGDNVIFGHFGKAGGVIDRDYFTFKIPDGQQLSAIRLEKQTQVGGNQSFIGIEKGSKVTVDPNNPTPEDLLGWVHFATEDEGTDLLPAICQGAGAKGCTPPLGPGSYAVWVQETGTCACQYRFTFVVSTAAD
jgi:hypothetical protein